MLYELGDVKIRNPVLRKHFARLDTSCSDYPDRCHDQLCCMV